MPSSVERKTTMANLPHEKTVDQLSRSPHSIPKKMPSSQKSFEPDLNGTTCDLDVMTFMRLPEVKAVTGLSKTSIYELIREKSFPAPVRLGPRAVAWVKSEIRQWALERVHASRSAA